MFCLNEWKRTIHFFCKYEFSLFSFHLPYLNIYAMTIGMTGVFVEYLVKAI